MILHKSADLTMGGIKTSKTTTTADISASVCKLVSKQRYQSFVILIALNRISATLNLLCACPS